MKALKNLREVMEKYDLFQKDDEVGLALEEAERSVLIAFGENICRALVEEDFYEVAKLIEENDGDIIGYSPKDDISELLEHAMGNQYYQIVSEEELEKINSYGNSTI